MERLMGIYQPYEDDKDRCRELKDKLLKYKPAQYRYKRPCANWKADCQIPETTTLLLVGPEGSGKTKLINNIMKLFRTTYNFVDRTPEYTLSGAGNSIAAGTLFLEEHSIQVQTNIPSFCLFDSKSLSNDIQENFENIRRWMTKGVRHGDPEMLRKSYDKDVLETITTRDQQVYHAMGKRRKVNYVIFVVSGVSVMEAIRSCNNSYFAELARNFHYPYLSFRDERPMLVVTHNDVLEIYDQDLVIASLGEALGISPLEIYDIPGDKSNDAVKLTMLSMLVDALEHADNSFPSMLPTLPRENSHKSDIEKIAANLALTMAIITFINLQWGDMKDQKAEASLHIVLASCFVILESSHKWVATVVSLYSIVTLNTNCMEALNLPLTSFRRPVIVSYGIGLLLRGLWHKREEQLPPRCGFLGEHRLRCGCVVTVSDFRRHSHDDSLESCPLCGKSISSESGFLEAIDPPLVNIIVTSLLFVVGTWLASRF